MSSNQETSPKRFMVGYDPSSGLFKAYSGPSDSPRRMLTEVSYSLVDIFEKCRKEGLVYEGLFASAIERVHYWRTVAEPILDYVQTLWEEPSQTNRGPIGFRAPSPPVEDGPKGGG